MEHNADPKPALAESTSFSEVASASSNIVLFFDVDDMQNTKLRLRNGDCRAYYIVHTFNDTETTVRREGHILATIQYHHIRAHRITFPGGSSLKLSEWLKAPVTSTFPLSFEHDGKQFEWRVDHVGRLSLHDLAQSATVAWFLKSRRQVENGKRVVYNAFIGIRPEYDHMRDLVVISCLLAEHKLRLTGETVGALDISRAEGVINSIGTLIGMVNIQ